MRRSIIVAILFALAAGTAIDARQQLQRINPPGVSTPATYSHIVRSGKTVYIAGQVATTADGKVAGATMKDQLDQVLKNLQTTLKSQGLDFSHVAKITIYTTSAKEFNVPEIVEMRHRYFGEHRPASTQVQVSALANPALMVEIEAIAIAP